LLSRLMLSARTVRQTSLYMVLDDETQRYDQTVSALAKSILQECSLLP